MNRILVSVRSAVVFSIALFALPAQATFHLWEIQEVYSNSDGSVQFIELFTNFNSQQFVGGQSITTATDGNTFTFPNQNSPSPTSLHHLLFATPGFASLPGGVTPNYTIPVNFFDPGGDTINFVGADFVIFASAPTDNINSLNFPGGTVATNSPTNYAGDEGSLRPRILAGDYNDDEVVDIRDYTAWRDNLGAAADTLPNDDDGGEIGAAHYTTWKTNFGDMTESLASLENTPVPEPAAAQMLVLAAVAVALLARFKTTSSNGCRRC
ncbi:MAG: hypothetical protein ACR2NU_13120 [Aeoliella sp.]